ncbi:hypothetical protein [Acrocarpospora sp. B8E8]|uniref:hypothetical protein n=1 Tax=Acrocarpospora sp. B8E8 TaxID=3153572 RepID=UPI00325CEBDE
MTASIVTNTLLAEPIHPTGKKLGKAKSMETIRAPTGWRAVTAYQRTAEIEVHDQGRSTTAWTPGV